MFYFSIPPSLSSSENFGAAVNINTGPTNRGATIWENSSPAPASQPSAQASSSNAVPGENQPKPYPQPQPRAQLQAKPPSQIQNATQLKANSSPEDSSEQPEHSSEATLKITIPFKRMMFYININPLH